VAVWCGVVALWRCGVVASLARAPPDLVISGFTAQALTRHPELERGMTIVEVNDQPAARMSTESVTQAMRRRPVTLTLAHRSDVRHDASGPSTLPHSPTALCTHARTHARTGRTSVPCDSRQENAAAMPSGCWRRWWQCTGGDVVTDRCRPTLLLRVAAYIYRRPTTRRPRPCASWRWRAVGAPSPGGSAGAGGLAAVLPTLPPDNPSVIWRASLASHWGCTCVAACELVTKLRRERPDDDGAQCPGPWRAARAWWWSRMPTLSVSQTAISLRRGALHFTSDWQR
jgi:hypothetical protein